MAHPVGLLYSLSSRIYYQLTRATSFIERLVYEMREASATPAVMERTGALISMIVTFRVLGVACLWLSGYS
ncbi:hypothetical protein AAHA92_24034 [Salvia divinorum]|uniref:Uncharacterized protein n=1 Tax=Salvia divinorum TaxID=28513 RepID=A0ABD1G987_SALDI